MKTLRVVQLLLVPVTALAVGLAVRVWIDGPLAVDAGRVALADTSFGVGLLVDRVSALLLLLVAGLALLVTTFARRHYDDGPSTTRFAVAAAGLVANLALTVTAVSLPVMALGWSLAGLAVAALVAHRFDPLARRAAATVTRRLAVGDLLLWAAVVAAAATFPDLDRPAVAAAASGADAVALAAVALLLVAAGAVRSALVPAHRWLVETTAAPTPVSALLHGGFVNGLGVIVVLWWPLLAASGEARLALLVLGATTIAVTTAQRRARPDVKGRLVTSTSGQMGFLAVQAGLGVPVAALTHLLGHALYKASLFLGAGSAVHAERRHGPQADHAAAAPLAVAAAGVTALLVLLWAAGLPPVPAPAALVLLGAAGLAALVGLRAVLQARLPAGRRVALGAGVVALLVAYVLGTTALDRALHAELPVWDGWTATTTAVLLAAVAVLVAGGVVADRRARSGHAPRLVAWATRGALPPRGQRPLARGPVPTPLATAGPTPAERARARVVAADAAAAVGATYPLSDFVASNPLAGLEHLDFTAAVRRSSAVRGTSGFLPLAEYRRLHRTGRIDDAALDAALVAEAPLAVPSAPSLAGRPLTPEAALRALLLTTPGRAHRAAAHARLSRLTPPGSDAPAPLRTVTELLDEALGTHLAALVDTESALWCAAVADRGDAAWPPLGKDAGLWSAWRRTAAGPGADRALGVPGFSAAVATLPTRADEAVATLLELLAVPADEQVDQAARLLGRLPGWTAHLRWADARTDQDGGPLELLAVRLTYEWALAEAVARRHLGCPGRLPDVRAVLASRTGRPDDATGGTTLADDVARLAEGAGMPATDLARATDAELVELAALARAVDGPVRQAIWQRAYEEHHRTPLLTALATRARAARPADRRVSRPERPAFQTITCIDVRSERLRRHLEARPGHQTIGFAGFFGVPFAYAGLDDATTVDQCPVLLQPRNRLAETPRPGRSRAADRGRRATGTTAAAAAAAHDVEEAPGTPLAFAELAGWGLGAAAALRTGAPRLAASARARLSPGPASTDVHLPVAGPGDGQGFTLDERTYLAEAALRTMGLVDGFARLVLVCGHGATTENNPFAAAYQCGACGGHDGAPNARAFAALLNEPAVRQQLAERHIVVPDDTWFTPGLHDTATDQVHLLEPEQVPPGHHDDLARLTEDLAWAGQATAAERWSRLPGGPEARTAADEPAGAARHAAGRAYDWAQTRPEWGLAGNAAFIAAPRELTAGLDLDGRAFLHSYRPETDPEGTALEVILTAPLVVAQWINTQYYFSSVDPEGFGAGDKVLHNVTGGLGVLTGPRGDLRAGLPRQAVVAADGGRVHEPLRLQAVVTARPALVGRIIERQPLLRRLVDNGWVALAVIDPTTGELHRWQAGGGWRLASPADEPATTPDDRSTAPIDDPTQEPACSPTT